MTIPLKNGLKAEAGRPEVENQSVMYNKTLFQKSNNLQEFKLFYSNSYVHIDSGRIGCILDENLEER